MTKAAIALSYQGGGAPRVTAKGQGPLAERIIALARQAGVPLHEDRDLLQLLAACDIDREIPEELYRAVAELLVFLMTIDRGLA